MISGGERHGIQGPVDVHRTYIATSGQGKAPVTPAKLMLGPCTGGAVRLAPAADRMLIGEGIKPVWPPAGRDLADILIDEIANGRSGGNG